MQSRTIVRRALPVVAILVAATPVRGQGTTSPFTGHTYQPGIDVRD